MAGKNSSFKIAIAVLCISLLIGELLALAVGWTFDRFVPISQNIVVLDSLALGLAILVSQYFTRYLVGRSRNYLPILLLPFGLMTGTGIVVSVGFFVSTPASFLYSGSRTISFLLINLLLFIAVNIISSGFIVFQHTLLESEKAISEEKVLKTQMELKLLASKINPHFLFNSLNLILSLLKTPRKAEAALIDLSEILRYQLDFGRKGEIPIKRELEVVEKYLAIQKLRFGAKLQYSIECDAEGEIPPLIVQPLVENCIKHNIETVERLTIRLSVKSDRGIGITVVDSQAKLEPDMPNRGIGLTVTKRRVEYAGGKFLIRNGGVEISFPKPGLPFQAAGRSAGRLNTQ